MCLAGQFIRERIGAVNIAQSFQDPTRIDVDGAADGVIVDKIPRQRLNIAIENDAHQLAGPVDHGTTRIATDNIGGFHGIQRSIELDPRLFLGPAIRQLVGILVSVFGRMIEGAAHGGEVGEFGSFRCGALAIFRIASGHAVA